MAKKKAKPRATRAPGGGRKSTYGEPTVPFSSRLPESVVEIMKFVGGGNATAGLIEIVKHSAEEIASDTAIRAERDRLSAIRQEEYEQKAREQKALLDGALSVAGPIELVDEEGWNKFKSNNTDGYGGRVVRYAEEWSRLMQTRLSNGETIPQCADELSRLADDDGITGYMYGCAVGVLAKVWKHGEALRRWHNKETQIGTEGDKANESGGVLNPALLSIG